MEEHGLRMFADRVLRGTPGPMGKEVLETQRKLAFTIFTQ
jgi:hypothetical protein